MANKLKNSDGAPEILLEFAAYKSTIEGTSLKTVDEYILDLKVFLKYIKSERDNVSTLGDEFDKIDISQIGIDFISKITTKDIYSFFMYTSSVRNNGASARARKLSAIKAFFKFLTVKTGKLKENPAQNIESPKKKQSLPKYLSLEESIDLLSAVHYDTQSKTRERDFAIITLFLNCGMRLSELVGINLYDIDKDMRSLRILGKGNKERIVYLNEACKDAILSYMKARSQVPHYDTCKEKNALFLSSRAKRISVKTVQYVVYKYLNAAGLEYKHFSTHKLRHTAATLMYQTGNVDIRVLKDILGHEQLNTTQIYTHVSNKSMESAANENPLAKLSKKDLGE